jgi:hypothetical protein
VAVLAVLDADSIKRYIKYQSGTGTIGDPFVPDQDGNATETTLAALNTKVPASPSTAGNQTTANTSLSSIDGKLTDVATQTTVAAILAKIIASPATEATLAAILAKLIASPATEATVAALLSSLGLTTDTAATGDGSAIAILKQLRTLYAGGLPAALVSGRLDVNVGSGTVNVGNFPSTQPVSGTVTANLGTLNGAATAANQSTEIGSLSSIDGKLTDVATQTTLAAIKAKTDNLDTALSGVKTGTDKIPASPATAGNQTTANTSLASIDTKTIQGITADYDTGAGTQNVEIVGFALPKSGGAVAGGTASDPIRNDPTGTTTQPVSVSSLPLPTGAATEATLANGATAANQSTLNTRVGDVTETAPSTDTASSGLNGRLQRIAQRITSLIALVPSALTGSGNFKVAVVESTASQTVSGTVTANLGTIAGVATEATLANAATAANQSTLNTRTGDVTETAPSTDTASSGLNGRLQRIAQRLTSLIALVPSALTGSGNFKTALVESTATVTVAPSGTFTTKETRAATPTQSSVAGSASSVSLLASNANRLGATIYNDSTAILYLKLGTTASTTSYTAQLPSNGYYEVPFAYTGAIDGIWATSTGNARVTELAA